MTTPAFTTPHATMPNAGGSARFWSTAPAVMFVTSMATLIQSFVAIKLFFLVLFLISAAINVALRQRIRLHPRLLWFYLVITVAGVLWALVGLFHPGNYVLGVFEALRLYCIWSLAFVVLYTLLRSERSLPLMHAAMVAAGILISVINLVGFVDFVSGWSLMPEGVRTALDLSVGFGDGYVKITSQNIGALFLIVPYLVTLQFRADVSRRGSALSKLSLLLALATVALSGRRGLWLVVGLTPCTILLLSYLTGSFGLITVGRRRFLLVLASVTMGVGAISVLGRSLPETGFVGHFERAFSSEDERTIQKPYLVEAFKDVPILGSGFGAAARYVRDFERPWKGYELTYYQMLFNLGVVGFATLALLFAVYFVLAIRILRQFKHGSAIPFALLVAFCSFLLGAYSNRYFGSFDLLFFVGLLPYLSTFRGGFERPVPTAGVVT